MLARPRIIVADSRADRPAVAGIVAIAVVGFAAGLLVVRLASGSGDEQSAEGTDAIPSHPAAPEYALDAGAPPAPAEVPAPTRDAGAPTAAPPKTDRAHDAGAPAALAPATATPDTGAHAPGTGRRSVVPGIVAYLRCDGLTPEGGRFPCPRDPSLEEAAWRAFEGLAACPGADPGSGSLEVRLELAGEALVDVRLRGGEHEGIDFTAVDRCVSPALRSVRSTLQPTRMVVAFHLELR